MIVPVIGCWLLVISKKKKPPASALSHSKFGATAKYPMDSYKEENEGLLK